MFSGDGSGWGGREENGWGSFEVSNFFVCFLSWFLCVVCVLVLCVCVRVLLFVALFLLLSSSLLLLLLFFCIVFVFCYDPKGGAIGTTRLTTGCAIQYVTFLVVRFMTTFIALPSMPPFVFLLR